MLTEDCFVRSAVCRRPAVSHGLTSLLAATGCLHCFSHYAVERCDTISGRSENPSCNYSQSFSCTSWGPFYASHSPYVHSLTIFFSVRYSPSHSLSLTDLIAIISGMLFQWMTRDFMFCLKMGSDLTFYKRTCQPLCILRRSSAF